MSFITIPRIIGAASLAMVGYNVAKVGSHEGAIETKNQIADDITDVVILNQRANSRSHVVDGLKNKYLHYRLDNHLFGWFKGIKNKFAATFFETVSNIGTLACGVGAMLIPNRSKFGKISAGICAGFLALQGIKVFTSDVLGIGKHNPLE